MITEKHAIKGPEAEKKKFGFRLGNNVALSWNSSMDSS